MMIVTVAADILRAALLYTRSEFGLGSNLRDEYRHVILDRTIVATDGHTMFIANPGEVKIEGGPARALLLHHGLVEKLGHTAEDGGMVTFMVGKQIMDAEGNLYPIETGEIVNWRKVYPRHPNGGTSQYNLLYLNRAVRANIELGAPVGEQAGKIHVHHNGTSGPCVAELHNRRAHVLFQYFADKNEEFVPFNV